MYDTDEDAITGQICHIKGRSPLGPRYDAEQTEEERDGFSNLLLMCSPHNTIVDSNDHKYTVPVLTEYKQKHEARFKNAVVQPALMQRFIDRFRELFPPVPPAMLKVAISFLRRRPGVSEDEYGLRIGCTNKTESTLRDLRLQVESPVGYKLDVMEIPAQVEGRSVLVTPNRVLLQLHTLRPAEHVGLRIFLVIPIEKYAGISGDKLRLMLTSANAVPETQTYGLGMLTEGLRNNAVPTK